MYNIEMKVDNSTNELTIVVDLSKQGNISKSGKSRVLARSHGNVEVPCTDLKLGLNLYRRA